MKDFNILMTMELELELELESKEYRMLNQSNA